MFKFLAFSLCFNFSVSVAYSTEIHKDRISNKINLVGDIETVENVYISFQQLLDYTLTDQTSWIIFSVAKQEKIASGKGSIVGYQFDEPGIYTIQIIETLVHSETGCNHSHYPSKLLVNVSENHMVFDFNSIQFSTEITGSVSANGVTLSVDVYFQHYENNTVLFKNKMKSEGVETSIIGEMISEQKLTSGKNKLLYHLSGVAKKDTYIMLDFVDINGQIQSYSLQKQL